MPTTEAGPATGHRRRPSGETLALVACSVALTAYCLAQASGRIIPETKLDVTLDPIRYLGRSLTAWDGSAGFGRLQNQAVGYLFPMGAFSALGHVLGVPPWITQRLWIAAILVVGLWGAHRLARLVGVGTPAGRVLAAVAYTAAPASVGTVAFQSAGQLPYALAPWVLVPLLGAGPARGPRRAAACSALAVLAMGGVNGASALAVLPLPLIWFATRAGGPDRRRLFGWWAVALAGATLWWGIALLVSVRYGLRFTSFTEQARITTSSESATEIWRGTGNWLIHLYSWDVPWLPGGWGLQADPVAIVGSILVAAAGAAGLARRDAPGRSFLLPAALVGAVAIGFGYAGPGGSGFGPTGQALLDGPLAVFRNVHKFSAVVHLPLCLGLGHLVSTASARASARRLDGSPAEAASSDVDDDDDDDEPGRTRPTAHRPVPTVVGRAAAVGAAVAIVLSLLPLATGRLAGPGSFDGLPGSWRQAARWVDRQPGTTRTLVLPAAEFGEYRWGRPLDEPWGVLADGDWAVRDLIPLGGNGSTRLLDGLDTALLGDHLPPTFLTSLQRAGVGHLVIRNDLEPDRTTAPRPATLRRLLATDPRIVRVAAFGPTVPATVGDDERLGPEPGRVGTESVRQVEVYRVPAATDRVAALPLAGRVELSGGPEALAGLPRGLVEGRAAFLTDDVPADADLAEVGAADVAAGPRIATDTARRRDVVFGLVRDNATYTLTADERSPLTGDPPVDRWPDLDPPPRTVARLEGASSLADDTDVGTLTEPEHQPFAAFDGDPGSTWAPEGDPVGTSLVVGFDRARPVPTVAVTVPDAPGRRVATVRVATDGGERTGTVDADGTAVVTTAPGATRQVRITIGSVTDEPALGPVGLAEVVLAGAPLRRPLVAAPFARDTDRVDAAWLTRATLDRYDLDRADEDAVLDREVTLADPEADDPRTLSGTASPVGGPALAALLAAVTPEAGPDDLTATGTGAWRDLPELAPGRAADGNPDTAWVSAPGLDGPELTLAWTGIAPVSSVRITPVVGGLEPPTAVTVDVDGIRTTRDLPASGVVTLPGTVADSVTLTFTPGDERGQVAVAEVEVAGLDGRTVPAARTDAAIDLACGRGPTVAVDGDTVPTRAETTAGALLRGEPVTWTSCDPVDLDGGTHRITGPAPDPATDALRADTLLVAPRSWGVLGGDTATATATSDPGGDAGADAGSATEARTTDVVRWDDVNRAVDVGAGPASVLTTTENHNHGWTATLDGRTLPSVRVEGWRQGFLVPAGQGGRVELRYGPDRVQTAGLLVGLAGVVGVVALALVPAGRRRARAWTPPAERTWPPLVPLALAAVVGVALAGPVALVLVPLVLLPRRAGRLPWLAAAAVLAAGVVALTGAGTIPGQDQGSFSIAGQVVATVGWVALAAAWLPADWPGAALSRRRAGSTPSTRDRSARRPR